LNIQVPYAVPVDSDEAQWLSPDERRAWIALMALVEVLPSTLDVQLKRDGGLNHFEYQVMAGLSEATDRAIRMSDLAVFASGSLSRLSHAVGRLEKKGWVLRRSCPADPRYVEAVLTDAGAAFMMEIAPAHVAEARRLVIDVLTARQVGQLEVIARRVVGAAAPYTAQLLDEGLVALPDVGVAGAAFGRRRAAEAAKDD
jgi:DNA-binding MarR family transcriptional regulator